MIGILVRMAPIGAVLDKGPRPTGNGDLAVGLGTPGQNLHYKL